MFTHGLIRWLCGISLFVMAISAFSSIVSADYDTATGAKPDLQSLQTVSDSTRTISTFEICADLTTGSRYAELATLLRDGITSQYPSVVLEIVDLTEMDADTNQIVLGDDSYQAVESLASACKQNTIDLGEEGYNLVARVNPNSTNGSWVILVYGDESKGVFHGIHALLDLIKDSGQGPTIGDYRVRDYPDRPFRGLAHWIENITGSGETWVNDQKENIEVLAGTGCNALNFGRGDFWVMEHEFDGEEIGVWLNELVYWARYYGIEPIPEIFPVAPYTYVSTFEDLPLLREGEFIEHEPFVVTSDGMGGKYLAPAIPQFDNVENNMSFETPGPTWPDQWQVAGTGWTYNSTEHYMRYSSNLKGYLKQVWPASTFEQGCLYVLEATFGEYSGYTTPNNAMWLQFDGFYNAQLDSSVNIWNGGIPKGPEGGGTFTKNFYFWMPPNREDAPAEYEGPFYDDFEYVRIMIYRLNNDSTITIRVDDLFLERRAAALRNVMYDPSYDLDFIVLGLDTTTTYTYGADFEWANDSALVEPGDNYRMPTDHLTNDNQLTVIWNDTTLGVDDSVLISYTAGVPSDWNPGQQATTYCWNNERVHDHIEEALRSLYKEFNVSVGDGSYAINPKFIDIRLDEVRGTNRCGRCVAAGRSNAEHFINYIKTFQEILDGIADEPGCEEAANTVLIVSANLLGPGTYEDNEGVHGSEPDYQFGWGGPWGPCYDSEGLEALSTTNVKLVIGTAYVQRNTYGWPQDYLAPGQTNVSVMAGLPIGESPEYLAEGDTWYEDDCIGFSTIQRTLVHPEEHIKLLDYAWKRHCNPDATMHALLSGAFVTDDVGGHTVRIEIGESVTFAPFGHPEIRDPDFSNYEIKSAEITGLTQNPVDVKNILNEDTYSHQFNREATKVATLTVESGPPGQSATHSQTAAITVKVYDGPIPEETEAVETKVVPFGIRFVAPNPFNPTTTIQFGLSRRSAVQLAIYDVRGRKIKTLLDNEIKPAGIHTVVWNGTSSGGGKVASGVYFLRLMGENQKQTKKLVLLK